MSRKTTKFPFKARRPRDANTSKYGHAERNAALVRLKTTAASARFLRGVFARPCADADRSKTSPSVHRPSALVRPRQDDGKAQPSARSKVIGGGRENTGSEPVVYLHPLRLLAAK